MNETEIWKPVPSVLGVEASSRGRINMLDMVICDENGERYIKGGIRPQYDNSHGYLTANVFYNGKWQSKKVHRLVAETFIPNPDSLPQVNHKNCIRTDNRVDNLEWCTASYNRQYTERHGEAKGRPLTAYDLKTFKKQYFHSQREAERKTLVGQGNINKVLKGEYQQAGGYYFTESKNEITKEKLQEIKSSILKCFVIAINLENKEPLCFKSQREAARQLGVGRGGISMVIRGECANFGGYWFTKADSNAVSLTREKFGNSVASKAAKLIKRTL